MVMAEKSQTYWNKSNMNHNMPFLPPSGLTASNLPSFNMNMSQEDAVNPLLNQVISHGHENPYLKDSQNPIVAPQKRFAIFDHSGNQTRLFFSPLFSAGKSDNGSATPRSVNDPFSKMGRANSEILMEPITEEKWDENHPTDEEAEDGMMLEDSKEIDALFYSDSDYDDENDDDIDEEVTSPFTGYNNAKDKSVKELMTEQVASSDSLPKKRKFLDCEETDSSKREKKVKIFQALKALESIIPGLNGADPISIIDQSIAYLKSMRIEVIELEKNTI